MIVKRRILKTPHDLTLTTSTYDMVMYGCQWNCCFFVFTDDLTFDKNQQEYFCWQSFTFSRMFQNLVDGFSQSKWTINRGIIQKQRATFLRSEMYCNAKYHLIWIQVSMRFTFLKEKLAVKHPKYKQELKIATVKAGQSIRTEETQRQCLWVTKFGSVTAKDLQTSILNLKRRGNSWLCCPVIFGPLQIGRPVISLPFSVNT